MVNASADHRLRVSTDVAVIGCDDRDVFSAFPTPGSTTVVMPFDQRGAPGAEIRTRQQAGVPTSTKTVMADRPLLERPSV